MATVTQQWQQLKFDTDQNSVDFYSDKLTIFGALSLTCQDTTNKPPLTLYLSFFMIDKPIIRNDWVLLSGIKK